MRPEQRDGLLFEGCVAMMLSARNAASVTPSGFDIAMAILTPGCAALHPGLIPATPSGFCIVMANLTPGCAMVNPGLIPATPSGFTLR